MENIRYDFNLSDSVSEMLATCAHCIDEKIVKKSDDDCTMLWYAWNSQAADIFVNKHRQLIGELAGVRDELLQEAEEIDRVSRVMYIKEEEAKRIAGERSV